MLLYTPYRVSEHIIYPLWVFVKKQKNAAVKSYRRVFLNTGYSFYFFYDFLGKLYIALI